MDPSHLNPFQISYLTSASENIKYNRWNKNLNKNLKKVLTKNYPNLNNQFKIIKICQQEEILSLETMLIHKELPQLNIQTEFLGKGAQLTTY